MPRPEDALCQPDDRGLAAGDDCRIHPAAAERVPRPRPTGSTDGTVFTAVEGRGRTRIGSDFVVDWQPRDLFVVPSWKSVVHRSQRRFFSAVLVLGPPDSAGAAPVPGGLLCHA